nr:TPA_asm: ND6 [Bombus balteatus]
MKTLLILNYLMFINMNINLLLIMNYFYLNIFYSPLKQLMYLIFYIVYMTINILMFKQNFSLNLYVLMIIFISGILIMFSYFICLINKISKKNNYMKIMFMNFLMLLLMMMNMKQMNMMLKNLNFSYCNFKKLNIIKKLYLKPNYLILLKFIIFLIMMLFIMTKICYIKNKNLRTKKWKK